MNSLDVMLSVDGLYVIVTLGTVGLVEVEGGVCYSLKLDRPYERENVLQPGGWIVRNIANILGPFKRPCESAKVSDEFVKEFEKWLKPS